MLAKYDITEFEIDKAGDYRYRVVVDDTGNTMIFKFHTQASSSDIVNQVDSYNAPVDNYGIT